MLQNNKQYPSKIVAYGAGVGKDSAKGYFFIDFSVDMGNETIRWIGSPLKNDGTINDMFATQLAEAGFDFEKNGLESLSAGMGSNLLNETGEITVRVAQKQNKVGELVWSIAWIGESKTATKEEISKALPPNINEMFRGKAPKAKRDAMGDIPF